MTRTETVTITLTRRQLARLHEAAKLASYGPAFTDEFRELADLLADADA